MRVFQIVMVAVSILLAGAALGRVNFTSRRYRDAEKEIIAILKNLGRQEIYYSRFAQVRQIAEEFVTGERRDRRLLADANEFIVEIADNEFREPAAARIIIGILRHGSDRNKANYLAKLLDAADLNPPSSRAYEPNSPAPNQPGKPLAITPPPVPARVHRRR